MTAQRSLLSPTFWCVCVWMQYSYVYGAHKCVDVDVVYPCVCLLTCIWMPVTWISVCRGPKLTFLFVFLQTAYFISWDWLFCRTQTLLIDLVYITSFPEGSLSPTISCRHCEWALYPCFDMDSGYWNPSFAFAQLLVHSIPCAISLVPSLTSWWLQKLISLYTELIPRDSSLKTYNRDKCWEFPNAYVVIYTWYVTQVTSDWVSVKSKLKQKSVCYWVIDWKSSAYQVKVLCMSTSCYLRKVRLTCLYLLWP